MILRLSDSISRGLLVVAALLVGLWLSFFGIRTAVAHYYSEGDSAQQLESACGWSQNNPAYWYMLGRYQQYNLEQPDSALAEKSYSKSNRPESRCNRRVVGSRHSLRAGWKDRGGSRRLFEGQEKLSSFRGCLLAIWKFSFAPRRTDARHMQKCVARSRQIRNGQRQHSRGLTGPIQISTSF